MFKPAYRVIQLLYGAPIALIVALACLFTLGPVPERGDNTRAAGLALAARGKAGFVRRRRL